METILVDKIQFNQLLDKTEKEIESNKFLKDQIKLMTANLESKDEEIDDLKEQILTLKKPKDVVSIEKFLQKFKENE